MNWYAAFRSIIACQIPVVALYLTSYSLLRAAFSFRNALFSADTECECEFVTGEHH